jgi:hypothetical protein
MTAADCEGVPLAAAMQHGRWKDARTARGYRRHSSLWQGILPASCSERSRNQQNPDRLRPAGLLTASPGELPD